MKITDEELAEQHLIMRAELTVLRNTLSFLIEKIDKKEFDVFAKIYPNLVRQELARLGSDLEWTDQDWGCALKDLLG